MRGNIHSYVNVSLCEGSFLISVSIVMFSGLLYLQNLLVQLQAPALNEIARCYWHFIRQVPQSTQGKLQSGVDNSNHGFLLHNSQQLLLTETTRRGNMTPWKSTEGEKKWEITFFVE